MPVTGEEGKAVSDYFEAAIKTVYVKEIKAPDKYAQSDVIHKVDVEAGKTVTISATDERVKGAVHIQKIDKETQAFLPQGDSSLAGAVYGLYAREDIVHPDGKTGVLFKKDSLIAQGVIKEDGTLDFSKLYLGKMYVKEITPPEGYTVDPTEYEVDLAYEGQEVAEVTRDLTVQEQVKKQAFQLIKISEDGDQTETDLVEGAGFKVYLISSLSKVESGELQPSNGDQFTAEDFRGYDFSKEEVAVTYVDGKAVPVQELITDKKGYALSPELPYGLYVVEESTVPENLKAIDPFLVKVDEDSREPMVWRVFDDRPFEFLLKIVKKDAQTGNPVLKAGASYKIFDMEKEEYVEQTVFYPKKETISVFKTNEEGYLVTPEELKCSTYRIEEVKAPEGFVRQGYESSLYEGEKVISPLEVTGKGSYKENPKKGIVITVSSDTAHQIDPDTGAVIVEVEQPNDEQVGSLTLTKTGEQPVEVKGDSLLAKAKRLAGKIKDQKQSIEFSEQRTERKYWLHQLAEELSDYYHLSLRDKLIYKSRIESVPSSTGTYISSESYFISLFVACIILLDIIDIPEKKKFLEGKSTFVASVLPELKAYQRFVNRLIGDGNSTVEESQFQSNCEEVVKVYKYAFETESDEYYERFEISRELKQKCIAASNGHKYY